MGTGAGMQYQDNITFNQYLYWQEVGPVGSVNDGTNYLPVLGFLVYANTTLGQEQAQQVNSSNCSATLQVGTVTMCQLGATFTLLSVMHPSETGQDHKL
jgi:hypothetical protein